MPIKVGSKALDFTLKTRTPEGNVDVTLSDNFGKRPTVLLFVPGAFTGVCTAEFCEVSQNFGEWDATGAAVYGVTNDSPWCLDAWAKQEDITIPLLSDFSHKVAQAYGVEIPDFSGLGPGTARAAIVVDARGIVQYADQTEKTGDQIDLGPVRATLRILAAART